MPACESVETAERPQWPRLYSLGRPRSHGVVVSPSLGPNTRWCYTPVHKSAEQCLCVVNNLYFEVECRAVASYLKVVWPKFTYRT